MYDLIDNLNKFRKLVHGLDKPLVRDIDKMIRYVKMRDSICKNIKTAFFNLMDGIDIGNIDTARDEMVLAEFKDMIYDNIECYTDSGTKFYEYEDFIALYNSILDRYPRFTELFIYVNEDLSVHTNRLKFLLELDKYRDGGNHEN